MAAWISKTFEGKKLYIALAAGAIAILVNHFVIEIPGMNLDPNNWLTDIWALVLVAFGGSKVNNVIEQQKTLVDEHKQTRAALVTAAQKK